MTKGPQGAFPIAPILTPLPCRSAMSLSRASDSNTVPLREPGGMVGNHVTRVKDVTEPLGRT